jgi:TIR domain
VARVFLSHNHKDKTFARRLGEDLGRNGVRVWIDEAELQVGDSLIRKIESAIAEVDYLAAVLSRNSVESEWVRRELDIALSREIHNKRVFVLPIVIDDCDVPGFLKGRIFADFRDPDMYKASLARVLQRLGASHPEPPAPRAPEGQTPFAIPVHAYRGETGEPDNIYQYVGSIPSREDGIYVNMVYLTPTHAIVDLLVPGAVYETYNREQHAGFQRESGLYDRGLGWIEIQVPRKGKSPQEVEAICLSIIEKHNEELRWLLYFAAPRTQTTG